VPAALLASDVLLDPTLPEHQSTLLKSVSVLRLHKLATIHVTTLQRRLGSISAVTQATVDSKLRATFGL
jgi:hypothetical protein